MPYVDTRTEIVVSLGEGPKRLDHFLANRDPDFSRTILQRLILDGHVTVERAGHQAQSQNQTRRRHRAPGPQGGTAGHSARAHSP